MYCSLIRLIEYTNEKSIVVSCIVHTINADKLILKSINLDFDICKRSCSHYRYL